MKTTKFPYVSIFALSLLFVLTVVPLRLPETERFNETVQPEKITSFHRPLVSKVVVILMDGVGASTAFRPGWMPRFQSLVSKGAYGLAKASFPTMTTNGVAALVTGRKLPSGMGFPGGMRPPEEYDSVIWHAHDAGLKVFVVGQHDWDALFGSHGADMTIIPYRGKPINYDTQVIADGMSILAGAKGPWNLLYMHMIDPDPLAHMYGLNSPEYREKLDEIDRQAGKILKAAGKDAVVIFTADHGQLDDGTHGGIEPEVVNVPFLMLGRRVRPGKYPAVSQRAIALTVAALLGLPPPALAGSTPALDRLDLSSKQRAAIMMAVLEQRQRRWIALRSQWHWVVLDPREQSRRAEDLYRSGKYEDAAREAEKAVARFDDLLGSVSPRQWFLRLVISLWLLVFACVVSLIWSEVGFRARVGALVAAACAVIAALLPSFSANLWPLSSLLLPTSSAALLAVALIQGAKRTAKVETVGWLLWWTAFAGLACPFLIDLPLWTMISVWGLCIAHATKSWQNRWRGTGWVLFAFVALSAVTMINSWIPSTETSSLRALLPVINLRSIGMPSWTTIEAGVWLALMSAVVIRIRAAKDPLLFVEVLAVAFVLLASVLLSVYFDPEFIECTWAAALLSIAIFSVKPVSSDFLCVWLSLLALLFCRTLLVPREFCFLGLATAVAWGLHGSATLEGDFWPGGECVILSLWSYLATAGRLSVSSIQVSEVYQVLGHHWHPHIMVFLLLVKHVALAVAPTIPLLFRLDRRRAWGMLPLLGAWSGGSLFVLWMQRSFLDAGKSSLLDDPAFELSLWAAFFAWGMMLTWLAVRKMTAFLERARRIWNVAVKPGLLGRTAGESR